MGTKYIKQKLTEVQEEKSTIGIGDLTVCNGLNSSSPKRYL